MKISDSMKRLLFAIVLMVIGFVAQAQNYGTVTSPTGIILVNKTTSRTEIQLPKIDGYTLYKADFHVHTIYSDGEVTPRERVREAWYDGLDIIAITDHLEIRTYEKFMLKALAPYNKKGEPYKYENAGIANKDDQKTPVMSDLNAAYDEAVSYVEKESLPVMVVRGTEIWRNPSLVGEFNALFLDDINSICHADLFECFRRVKEQGGIIMHNHPGWRRKNMDISNQDQVRAYEEGWVDGVEMVNGFTLYPSIARRCVEKKLFMAANTDVHRPSSQMWNAGRKYFRTMTFIMAEECTEDAIKEALLQQRTICYCANNLMGEQKYLDKFLNAAVECKVVGEDAKKKTRTYNLKNTCSVPFLLRTGAKVYELEPFQSVNFTFSSGTLPIFTVDNMWHVDEQHPELEVDIDE